jgi:hypothetical protein
MLFYSHESGPIQLIIKIALHENHLEWDKLLYNAM